jgi:6-phosphogluconate dehydrogenase (decarboxylating)
VDVGLVGLGRMGANMARRWRRHGHTVIGYARTAATVEGLVADGAIDAGAGSLAELVGKLAERPRVLWLMVPAASVDATFADLVPLLDAGDIVIDAATPGSATTSGARASSPRPGSGTSTSGPAAAPGASSAGTVS